MLMSLALLVPIKKAGLNYEDVLGQPNYLVALILALMMHHRPGISQYEANIAFSKGKAVRCGHGSCADDLPLEGYIIYDFVRASEARSIKDGRCKTDESREANTADAESRREIIKKTVKPAWPKGKPKPAKAQNIPAWKASDSLDPAKTLAYITAHSPSSEFMKTSCDPVGGRLRLVSAVDFGNKSVSWIRRGFEKYAAEAVWQMWSQYQRATGLPVPLNLHTLPPLFA